MSKQRRLVVGRPLRRLLVLVLLVAGCAGGASAVGDSRHTTITASFAETTGLYEGDEVRVLGVLVGKVVEVTPEGDQVRVTMEIDHPVPEDASAAIVNPTLVSGRFVQLSPAYEDGPTMQDGAHIPRERTATPLSFDDVKHEITDLATALGPDGPVGRRGALDRAITTIDANLRGDTAEVLRDSITQLRAASETLDSGGSDLFATIDNLDSFTRNLATYDNAVASFVQQLTGASDLLADNRSRMSVALKELVSLVDALGGYADRNKTVISRALRSSSRLAQILAEKSESVADILHTAPHSIAGLYYTVENEAVTGRVALANLDDMGQLLCGLVLGAGGTAQACTDALGPLLDVLGLSSVLGVSSVGEGS